MEDSSFLFPPTGKTSTLGGKRKFFILPFVPGMVNMEEKGFLKYFSLNVLTKGKADDFGNDKNRDQPILMTTLAQEVCLGRSKFSLR